MGERIHLGRNVTGENIAGTGKKDVFEISDKTQLCRKYHRIEWFGIRKEYFEVSERIHLRRNIIKRMDGTEKRIFRHK